YNPYKERAFTQKKRIPVLINYSFGGKRFDKKPDATDLANQEKIDDLLIQNWFPKNEIIPGDEIGRLRNELINDVSELIPKRALIILSALAKSATVDNRLNLI